jgi:hypothetical protein
MLPQVKILDAYGRRPTPWMLQVINTPITELLPNQPNVMPLFQEETTHTSGEAGSNSSDNTSKRRPSATQGNQPNRMETLMQRQDPTREESLLPASSVFQDTKSRATELSFEPISDVPSQKYTFSSFIPISVMQQVKCLVLFGRSCSANLFHLKEGQTKVQRYRQWESKGQEQRIKDQIRTQGPALKAKQLAHKKGLQKWSVSNADLVNEHIRQVGNAQGTERLADNRVLQAVVTLMKELDTSELQFLQTELSNLLIH